MPQNLSLEAPLRVDSLYHHISKMACYLESLGELEGLLLTERDACPFEDACLLHHVGDDEGLVLGQQGSLRLRQLIDNLTNKHTVINPLALFKELSNERSHLAYTYLLDKVLALLNVLLPLMVGLLVLNAVDLVIELRVLDLEVGLLH